ncbi:MAG: DUF4331 domain-containing protein [Rubrivivax sp.]|nr:MAG: DUF4331 domain-containing protein [Rubrivivax sp.]
MTLPPFKGLPRALLSTAVCTALAGLATPAAQASSHREAPSIAGSPRIDGTDFYMFRSYESGRAGYVTLIANYLPLQDPYGGPNYFKLDPNALYEIHVDSNGDAKEDVTFQFQFKNVFKAIALPVGNQTVPIPLTQAGQVTAPNAAALNVNEKFTLNVVRGDRRTGTSTAVNNPKTGTPLFDKPSDNIGVKTIPDYAGYAAQHVYSVDIPGCGASRVFVGQRQEGFAVNLGVITDPSLINAAAANSIQNKNVTSLALEVPIACLTQGSETTIGGWTTASVRQSQLANATPPSGYNTATTVGGAWVQVSRLGMPLVNEVVIGLPDKDKFNASVPSKDGQFATYVTNPTLPALLEIALALPGTAPTNFPRLDLVTTFLTGIPGVNKPANVVASEMLRLNTAIAPTAFAQQQRLGIVGSLLNGASDFAGYPNGRRPKDDIVDISLVAVMGGLCMANGNGNALGFGLDCNPSKVPLGNTAFKLHDAVDQAVVPFLPGFPYLNTPNPGSK